MQNNTLSINEESQEAQSFFCTNKKFVKGVYSEDNLEYRFFVGQLSARNKSTIDKER